MARKLLCTLYDVEANIPELYSTENNELTHPIGLILHKVQMASAEILRNLVQYFGSDVEISPYLTYPIARPKNFDKNSYLKQPTLLDTTNSTKEADTYIITFISDTDFKVVNFNGANAGSGDTTSDFTSSDSIFKIVSSDWVGPHHTADQYIFAFEVYEEVIRAWASYKAAHTMLLGRYVSEQVDTIVGLVPTYSDAAKDLYEKIITTAEIQLEGQKTGFGQPPISQEPWHGYNIDTTGLLQDPPVVGEEE